MPPSYPPGPNQRALIEQAVARLKSPILTRMFQKNQPLLQELLVPRSYGLGVEICRFDQPTGGIWVVIEGEVSLTRRSQDVDTLATESRTAGGVFGNDGTGDLSARAETAVTALFLSDQAFGTLCTQAPDVAEAAAFFAELNERRGDVMRALRMAVPFRNVPDTRLAQLIECLDRRAYAPGDVAVHQDADPTGVYVVLDGELRATRRVEDRGGVSAHGAAATEKLMDVMTPGEVFGDVAMFTAEPEPLTIRATQPSLCAFLTVDVYHQLIATSPGFRRRIGPSAVVAAASMGTPLPEAVLLVGRPEDHRAIGVVTELVAQHLAAAHHHRPLLLHVAPQGRPSTPTERAGVFHQTVPADAALINALINHQKANFDPIFLVPDDPSRIAGLVPAVGRVIYVAEDVYAPLPVPALAARPLRLCALNGGGGDPRGYPSRTLRLRARPVDFERLAPSTVTLTSLAPPLQDGIGRLGRAITERLVGLALGGGGAWGFAHVALIRAMLSGEVVVPIDMVSGASFGALAAAFYCAKGLPGLDLLVKKGWTATPATQLSMVSSRAYEWWVDRHLPASRLEGLAIPLLPVATDVAFGIEYIPRTGTVGHGVRASGAMPPLFTPVLRGTSRMVDGGFINNVPASVLRAEGANFVVASNVIATQRLKEGDGPVGNVARFMSAVNPVARMMDFVHSALVLFHTTGLRESFSADASFTSTFAGMEFWNFGSGEETIRNAESAPSFAPSIRRIKERWIAFSVDVPMADGTRGGSGPTPSAGP